MSFADSVKKKFEDILKQYGNDVTLSVSSFTENSMGDFTPTPVSSQTIKAISMQYFPFFKELRPYADLNAGDTAFLVKSDYFPANVDAKTLTVDFEGSTYLISAIKNIRVQNKTIATRLVVERGI